MKFIIKRKLVQNGVSPLAVVAPPGYYRGGDGQMVKDAESAAGGPEWGKSEHAYEFKSHRAAMRVANMCHGVEVAGLARTSRLAIKDASNA